MISEQIDRLRHDSSSLGDFIEELRQSGDEDRLKLISEKKAYLDEKISEISAA